MCQSVADTVGFMTNDTPPDKRHCCEIGCDKPAEFTIWSADYLPDSNTDACREHVGELLGFAEHDKQQIPRWNVSAIPAPV